MDPTPETPSQTSPLQEKWGDGLGGGFLVVPSVLLKYQEFLQLDCEELVLLLNLLAHWWERTEMPFPRAEGLAQRTGLSRRTVQRRLQQLEKKGLIARVWKTVNDDDPRAIAHYDLQGLVAQLEPLGAYEQAYRKDRLRKSQAGRSQAGSPAQ